MKEASWPSVSKACNRGTSRLGKAWPRPRLGRKTYWHKDKGLWGLETNNTIIASKVELDNLVISAVSSCQCISAKIEHNSDRCHGEMYFDIVLVYCHQTRKQKTPSTNRKQKHNRGDGGEGQATQRVARVVRYDRPVMGLPCWPPFFLKLKT